MPTFLTTRRVIGAAVGLALLLAAFTAGVVAGAGSEEDHPAAAAATTTSAGVLDDAAAQIAGQALKPVDRETLDAAAIQGMLRAAGDEWGTWSDGTDPADLTSGAAGGAGIGVWLRTARSGRVVVARVTDGSPAAVAGVLPGDEVRAVDGRSAARLAAPIVAAALRGPVGSRVTLVTSRDAVLRPLKLTRVHLEPAAVSVDLEPVANGGPSVGRITVPSFKRGVGRDVRAALARLHAQHADGVILDLRGDPGGLLDEAVETASAFLDGGRVVSYTRRGGSTMHLDAVGTGDVSLPVVVLVDGGTASAAEVVAGALQDRGRAVLVGSRTFGKGTVQEPRTLSDGSALELTVARYATPSGRSLDRVGLAPDIDIAAGSAPDVAVRRALDVLTGLVADSTPVTGGRG
ncbi:MAG: carboxyl-terminal processing protease [Actinomycetota bacterium]|jgi:carboxyl-terminal processing protease|nr:carboxyl-terminal processing protease [Actinomycetota bacterium]